jgi:hypothetical protein
LNGRHLDRHDSCGEYYVSIIDLHPTPPIIGALHFWGSLEHKVQVCRKSSPRHSLCNCRALGGLLLGVVPRDAAIAGKLCPGDGENPGTGSLSASSF